VTLLLVLGLAAATPTIGPDAAALTGAIRHSPEVSARGRAEVGRLRTVRCREFDEEPSEYRCRFDARDRGARWRAHRAIVAIDGRRWVLLDLD
jgi:hypothetical protein